MNTFVAGAASLNEDSKYLRFLSETESRVYILRTALGPEAFQEETRTEKAIKRILLVSNSQIHFNGASLACYILSI
ncbi:hypothetical protein BHYA_0035g00250 [Botrytis hyacinthi]|uniref:Uncharacterized protein n=1 Tax=Botrytis hyacinthi TaxID=278943 RepID=A0A4Z1GZ97_9HELO|nr:hypothetical protein BHYA_0035g00250 [Botrytis hyacinthi]